tara:strand:- start:571 stop:1836 length:1266 start_codon:yes stop_codon:yes gene_type:complete
MTDIKNKILNLVNQNDEYVLALSGGVDSAVLASIFNDLNLSYRTIFINHNQKDSNLLQKSAEEIAKNLKTSHENIFSDLEDNVSETKMREKRYSLLFNNLKKGEILVTGHHKNDKVETFFINLFRGTRLKGLTSIKAENENLLRPLINAEKSEILDYAIRNNIVFTEDTTNQNNEISRNWIRNKLIPEVDERFSGEINKKISNLILEIEVLLESKEEVKKYIKFAKGYFEVPLLLIQENDSRTNYLISLISSSIGQSGLQGDDLKKIFSAISNGSHVSYHKNWLVSYHAGLVIFIEKEMWKLNSDKDMVFGFFNFQETTKCNYLNNWKLLIPNNFIENLNLSTISKGDKILVDGSLQKVSEVMRSFGVKEPLREVWPIAKIDNKVIWIPGIRKSDLVKDFDSENNKNTITTVIEKSNFESI